MKVLFYAAAIGLLAGCQPALQRLAGSQAPAQAIISGAALEGPVMRVQIPSRGADAQLSRVAVSNGVETWLSADNISLSFRDGVLVASRGLGFDLMGANADGTLAALAGQGEPVYRRKMRYLTGDHKSTYLMVGCQMKMIGSETIGGQRLQRMEEQCQAHQDTFTNVFWRNAVSTIVQSEQWVSPEIGYLRSSIGSR
jgi:hypothetical protein